MSEVVERVARSLALSAGGIMIGGGQSVASREFRWSGDGEYLDKYVEAHWKEHVHAAEFAISALRKPTKEMIEAGHNVMCSLGAHDCEVPMNDIFCAMIDEALK